MAQTHFLWLGGIATLIGSCVGSKIAFTNTKMRKFALFPGQNSKKSLLRVALATPCKLTTREILTKRKMPNATYLQFMNRR